MIYLRTLVFLLALISLGAATAQERQTRAVAQELLPQWALSTQESYSLIPISQAHETGRAAFRSETAITSVANHSSEAIWIDTLQRSLLPQERCFLETADYREIAFSASSSTVGYIEVASLAVEDASVATAPLQTRSLRPSSVDEASWSAVLPYLMPDNHPLKAKLDRFFSEKRVTLNAASLEKAKFKNSRPGQFSHVVVTKHAKFKGYYFKLYTDEQVVANEWLQWVKRTSGAQAIREAIKRHGYEKIFKVPQKWIYVLPEHPAPPEGFFPKHFLLVAEDMDILAKEENKYVWKSQRMNPVILDAFYTILQELGLCDSIYPFNSPFSQDGKIAFIDTEYSGSWPIYFDRLLRYLSPSMRQHWQLLIDQGGPR